VATKEAAEVVPFREQILHARCGGLYLAHSKEEIVPDDGTCPVCKRVLAIKETTFGRQIVTTAGTPLADELGMEVSEGKPGPAEPAVAPVASDF
jgi:hypothetical protein